MTDTYTSKIACLNCNLIEDIQIEKGKIIPEFIAVQQLNCTNCGCETLTSFDAWKAEKKIMKDIILHHNIEHMEENEPKPTNNNDQYQ